jgi:hypothetical protein
MTNIFVGFEVGLPTLHHGTGVGRAIPLPEFYVTPDGRKFYCDTGTATNASPNSEVRIVNGNELARIQLSQGTNFITIADNWERMIVVKDGHRITLCDLSRFINEASPEAGVLATLTLDRWINSAMFFGQETNSILVTDYSNKVMIWKYDYSNKTWREKELFRGDYSITYAETNGDGKQFVIIESISSGDANIGGVNIFHCNRGEMV